MADTQRKIPAHVAIIMDGNGRWAKKRGLPRTMGHAQGRTYMKTSLAKCAKNNVRIRVIGDKSRLDPDLQDSIRTLEEATKNNTGIGFQIAINYGSRDEIARAVRKIAQKTAAGELRPEDITEETISDALDTAGIPDPDLLIRTCGEERLSNFLMWQLSYSEMYFTDTAWPDFTKEELEKAVDAYNHRERRFGGLTQ